VAAAPTRIANRISGSTSPSASRLGPATAPSRLRGMNISTSVPKLMPGWAAFLLMVCCALLPYSCISWPRACSSRWWPGCTVFIITRPIATAMPMLRKNSRKVRPASGPSRSSRPSWATPEASEVNTSGITTKNSMRRKICPNGSNTAADIFCISASVAGCHWPMPSVTTAATTPITRPQRMRFARGVDVLIRLNVRGGDGFVTQEFVFCRDPAKGRGEVPPRLAKGPTPASGRRRLKWAL